MDCVFCSVLSGVTASHRVFEDEVAVAFLDRRPLFPGHVLVVPREHVETLTDLPPGSVGPFFERVRVITSAVERGMAAAGSFVALNNRVSQSVPHLHVHVVPRNRKDGLRGFFWPRGHYGDEDHARRTADLVRAALAADPDARTPG
jgi:histidine triad (HIT) family protein